MNNLWPALRARLSRMPRLSGALHPRRRIASLRVKIPGSAAGLRAPLARLRRLKPAALPKLPPLPGGLRLWITLVSLGFVMAALLAHGRQLLQLSLDGQGWLWLLLGVGLSLLSLVVNGLAWGAILRWFGLRPRWEALVSLYLATNLRKYLPGNIWHLASRVQVLRAGPPTAPLAGPLTTPMALAVTLVDPLLAAVAALALMALAGWRNGFELAGLLPLLLLLPRWLNPLLRRLERKRARSLGLERELEREALGQEAEAPVRGYPWPPLLAQLVFVLLRFAGFACCVWAFDLQLSTEWLLWLAGFCLAWTAGLVVPGAPGGLGVFEAVLLLRLGEAIPESSLLAVALSYRLIVTVADLLAAGLVALDGRLARAWPTAAAAEPRQAAPGSGA